jgi:hypothetical protein
METPRHTLFARLPLSTFSRLGKLALSLACAAGMASACVAATSDGDEHTGAKEAAFGHYDLSASYAGDISATRGWIVEWQIPDVLNSNAWGAVGEWYYNLESGVYRSGGGFFIYFFDDNNGYDAMPADCHPIWGSGGWCDGSLGPLPPGSRVQFKYEKCSGKHTPDLNGDQICLSFDREDGMGWRFLAQDIPTTVEMYTHDIEWWDDYPEAVKPVIPCSSPTRMLHQEVEDANGRWNVLSGASNWKFAETAPFHFINKDLDAYPASWESCTTPNGPGNYNVPWSALAKLHPGCSTDKAAMTTDCAAAYSRFCSAGGLSSGYGPISKSQTEVTLTCINGSRLQAHLSDWAKTIPDCNQGSTSNSECAPAVNRRCQQLGFASGFGPVERAGDDITIVCLDSGQASRQQTTYSNLRNYSPACDGSSERSGGDCSYAVSQYCIHMGAKSGFGPVENSHDDVTVVCTYF